MFMTAKNEGKTHNSIMKTITILFSILSFITCCSFQEAEGFICPATTTKSTALLMTVMDEAKPSNSGRSREEIEIEVSSGRALENGPTVDFESVKDTTSKAELALAQARVDYLAAIDAHRKDAASIRISSYKNSSKTARLMGINDEVVKEVGREIGESVDDDAVQRCAAYLRSRAPDDIFEPIPNVNDLQMENGSGEKSIQSEVASLMRQSYEESGLVTAAFAKTFYLATQLLSEDARKAIWAIYVWCRRTDEIVDAPRKPEDVDMLTDLSAWEIRLEKLFRYGMVEDILDLALLDCLIKCPELHIQPFLDMVRGMLMDIPDLGQDRYETFDELQLYCYRVAGTVGLMSMPFLGCAEGFTEEEAKEPALSLGVAFQITNILRDVGEDAVNRGRIYLPREDMAKFGVTEEQIFAQKVDDKYVSFMKYQISRARMYYERAKRGVTMLSPQSRLTVQTALDCYGSILNKIEENNYDSLTKRAYLTKWEKLAEIPFSWYRTQDIAKIFPLPGES